ncbi:trypsin-like peptidase domain-containing protein [bacterium]|nr:trypsin-like peptidase domain-containing protein [bacterium]
MMVRFKASRVSVLAGTVVAMLSSGGHFAWADQPAPVTKEGSLEFRRVVKTVLPAVVSIQASAMSDEEKAKRKEDLQKRLNDMRRLLPPEFRKQIEKMDPDDMPEQLGFGSGVIIDKRGVILTNNHVVENAKKVKVILQDNREFEATDIIRDPKADVAIVRLNKEDISSIDLPVAQLGDSSQVEIGDWVLAMGSPFGLTGTVTSGIVSAKGRTPPELNLLYKDFIQTDAAINPGNSGGPLVDLDGKIIGINTAIRSNTGSFGGIGFAIPSNMVKNIADQLDKFGRVKRSYLGIAMRPLAKKELTDKKLDTGVEVTGLADGQTPARKAGLKPKDIILSVDGKPVKETQELQDVVSSTPAGNTIAVQVVREGQPVDIKILLEEQPESFGVQQIMAAAGDESILGMQILEQKGKLLVTAVEEGSPAAQAGVEPGDTILKASGKEVTTNDQFKTAVEGITDGVLLKVQKEDGSVKLLVVGGK